MSAKSKIEALALSVAEKAMEKDTGLQDRIDALKVLTPYYAALIKGKKQISDEDGEPTFADLTKGIEEHVNGIPQVRTGRGRAGTDA